MSTTPVRCDNVRDDIDACAIGALDRDEARRLEQHVAGCADCRRLLDDARGTAAALALSVPLIPAVPTLKAHLMARTTSISTPVSSRRAPSRWWFGVAAAALLVAALAGVSAWAAVTQRRVDRLDRDNGAVRAAATAQAADLASARAALATMTASNARMEATLAMQRAMVDVMAQPDAQHVDLHGTSAATGASAQYVWSPARGTGVMMADGLPQLAAGQTYQAWAVYDIRWESAGTFSVDSSGSGIVLVSASSSDDAGRGAPSWYCVTIEPAGGSTQHTGTMVLTSLSR